MVQTLVAGAMIVAAVLKLRDPAAFRQTISDFGIVLPALIPTAAVAIVALELAGGAALLVGRRTGLIVVSLLLALFCAVLSYGIARGLDFECGCFGSGDLLGSQTLRSALIRAAGLLGMCGYLAFGRRPRGR